MSEKSSKVTTLLALREYVKDLRKEYQRSMIAVEPKDEDLKRLGQGLMLSYSADVDTLSDLVKREVYFVNDPKITNTESDTGVVYYELTLKDVEVKGTTVFSDTTTTRTYKRKTTFSEYEYKKAERGKDIPELLYDLLIHKTPHKHEKVIQNTVLTSIRSAGHTAIVDDLGNIFVQVSKEDASAADTIFSSHLDTVHSTAGLIDLYISTGPNEANKDFVFAGKVDKTEGPSVLGADDKVGVYIMLRMIEQHIPGTYIFHVGEECGCVGSKEIVRTYKQAYEGKKRCIAFDRKGYNDVITSQRGRNCCSKEFEIALSNQLNDAVKAMSASNDLGEDYTFSGASGAYTDSAEYMGDVPECTNLSVGYFDQHTEAERFDIYWLESLFIPALFKINWEELPTERDPKAVTSYSGYGGRRNYGGYDDYDDYYGYGYAPPGFQGSWSDYSADLPRGLYSVPAWEPIDGLLPNLTKPEMNGVIRKWSYKFVHDMCMDMHAVLGDKAMLEDQLEESTGLLLNIEDGLAKVVESLSDCKTKADLQKAAAFILEFASDTSKDIDDCNQIVDYYELCSVVSNDNKEDDDERLPLPEQKWSARIGGDAAFLVPEHAPDDLDIEYDILTNRIYVEGRIVTVYSKKGKPISDKHLPKITNGTPLYARLNGTTLTHVITVDDSRIEANVWTN